MANDQDPIAPSQPETTAEFDHSQYPDRMKCRIIPNGRDDIGEIQVTDSEMGSFTAEVPIGAVIDMKIGQAINMVKKEGSGMAADSVKSLEDHIGTGLLACRVVDNDELSGQATIAIPLVSGSMNLVIPAKELARRL